MYSKISISFKYKLLLCKHACAVHRAHSTLCCCVTLKTKLSKTIASKYLLGRNESECSLNWRTAWFSRFSTLASVAMWWWTQSHFLFRLPLMNANKLRKIDYLTDFISSHFLHIFRFSNFHLIFSFDAHTNGRFSFVFCCLPYRRCLCSQRLPSQGFRWDVCLAAVEVVWLASMANDHVRRKATG